MGAWVCALNHHRHKSHSHVSISESMAGRMRTMTTITLCGCSCHTTASHWSAAWKFPWKAISCPVAGSKLSCFAKRSFSNPRDWPQFQRMGDLYWRKVSIGLEWVEMSVILGALARGAKQHQLHELVQQRRRIRQFCVLPLLVHRCCTAADRTCSCRSASADWSASRCTPCFLLPLRTVIHLSGVQPWTRTRLQYFHRALVSPAVVGHVARHSVPTRARLALDAARLAQSPRCDGFTSSAVFSKRNRLLCSTALTGHSSSNCSDQLVQTKCQVFPSVKLSAKFSTPGVRFIFTLLDVVTSWSPWHFNSMCRFLPNPFFEAIALAALESVQALTWDLSPKSMADHRLHSKAFCGSCSRPRSILPQPCANARVACVQEQCLATDPLYLHCTSTWWFPFRFSFLLGLESTCTSTFTSSTSLQVRISHVTFSTPLKFLHAFSSLFQLPRVGFAIFVQKSFAGVLRVRSDMEPRFEFKI